MLTEVSLMRRAQDSGVIPVIVIDKTDDAVPLARALHEGGLSMIEVTLRTPVALEAIRIIRAALPDLMVGAGTVTDVAAATAARSAGAQFMVSPGYSSAIGAYCKAHELPLLPGVATATEVMEAMNEGFRFLKFFPAEAAGGTAMLQALRGPFPEASFCPTGGVSASNAGHYLALDNVVCVGGSWMAPRDAIQASDWQRITGLSRQALNSLRKN